MRPGRPYCLPDDRRPMVHSHSRKDARGVRKTPRSVLLLKGVPFDQARGCRIDARFEFGRGTEQGLISEVTVDGPDAISFVKEGQAARCRL